MFHFYILGEDGNPIEEPDIIKWVQWFIQRDAEGPSVTIGYEKIDDVQVSTVFLGTNIGGVWKTDKPIVFETMVFGGKHNGRQWRCSTLKEAQEQHALVLKFVRDN